MKVVEKFLAANNLEAEVVLYTDIKERDNALKKGYIDVMIAEGYNAFQNQGIEVCLEAGGTDFYMVVNKARPDILEDLNQAQHRLYQENPQFISDLARKWCKRTSFTTIMSPGEKKWLAEHQTITVGYLNDYMPYCGKDEDGNVTGVITDIVPEIFKSLGVSINVEYKGYDTALELNEALHQREVDVIFPTLSNYWVAEMHELVPSVPVVSSYFNLLYVGEYPDMTKAKLAVSKRRGTMEDYRTIYYPNNEVIYCTDIYDWIVGNNLQQITSNVSINQIQNGTNNVQTLLIKNGNNKYNHLRNILFFWFLSNLIIFIFGYFVLKLYCSFTVKMTEITKRRNKVHAK